LTGQDRLDVARVIHGLCAGRFGGMTQSDCDIKECTESENGDPMHYELSPRPEANQGRRVKRAEESILSFRQEANTNYLIAQRGF
jgi:hypothetical protein